MLVHVRSELRRENPFPFSFSDCSLDARIRPLLHSFPLIPLIMSCNGESEPETGPKYEIDQHMGELIGPSNAFFRR